MADILTLNGVLAASIATISGVQKANIATINGVTMVNFPFILESDADADNYVCQMEAVGAGDDEPGAGFGLSSPHNTLVEQGTIPAAVSGFRTLNGSNQDFLAPVNLINAFLPSPTWLILMNIKNILTGSTGTNDRLCYLSESSTAKGVTLAIDATEHLFVETNIGGSWSRATCTDVVASGTEYWVAAWADGVNNARIGFKTGDKPTAWSSFASTKRGETAHGGDFSGVTFNQTNFFSLIGTQQHFPCDAGTISLSKDALA